MRLLFGLIAFLFPLIVRLAMLPALPIPVPAIHDEFGYLLAGDTFAMGRLANPPHLLWMHFESMHVISQPTYMAMYPPLQGAWLALGKLLFGHPWWGVLLSVGVLSATIYWLLEAWLIPGWALAGSIAVAIYTGGTHHWMNSYWGGAAAAIGGCVALGAFGRLIVPGPKHPSGHSALLAIGTGMLANSRPWEGFLLCLPLTALFLRRILAGDSGDLRSRLKSMLLPWAFVLSAIGLWSAYYNWRITGSPLRHPHMHQRASYAVAPMFAWQSRQPPPAYNHDAMARFYLEWEPTFQNAQRMDTWAGWASSLRQRVGGENLRLFLASGAALALLAIRSRERAARYMLLTLGFFLAGTGAQRYFAFHYCAPVFGLIVTAHFIALSRLSTGTWKGRPVGRILAPAAAACLCLVLLFVNVRRIGTPSGPFGQQRAAIARRLQASGGRHLVMVRYSPEHDSLHEWVYNGADLDNGAVIWARAMSEEQNRKLIDYYRDRRLWLLEPDSEPLRLQDYPAPPGRQHGSNPALRPAALTR